MREARSPDVVSRPKQLANKVHIPPHHTLKVYDATSYLTSHPGMGEMIVRKAGSDVSRDFDMHMPKQKKIWARLQVGRVRSRAQWRSCNGECQSSSATETAREEEKRC